MPRCRTRLLPLLFLAACATGPDSLSRQLLTPPTGWLAEPADVGLAAEWFEIVLHKEASLTGFWIPNPAARGRTVVLFHDANTNVSALHPYYTFLHRAGFQVLAFDARGYGKSKGSPTLQAWLYDLPKLFAWLYARPDVDRQQLAFYGTGIGSLAALWAARTEGCRALVVEHLPSPRAMLRESTGDKDSAFGAYAAGIAEFANLPENLEPIDNAPHVAVPALFVTSDGEPARDRTALLDTYREYAGPHQLWLLQGTRQAPHGLLTYDGEYQTQICTFLAAAFAGSPRVVSATVARARDASDGEAWYEFDLTLTPPVAERTAVEALAVLADGSWHFARTWLEGSRARVRLKLPSAPTLVSAMPVPMANDDPTSTWVRTDSALRRSGLAVAPLWPQIEALRNGALPPAAAEQLALDLNAAEAKEPFHSQLETELADVFALLGKQFVASTETARRDAGTRLLQRAVAAAPAQARLQFWPGPTASYGFPQEDAVDQARRLLAAPTVQKQ